MATGYSRRSVLLGLGGTAAASVLPMRHAAIARKMEPDDMRAVSEYFARIRKPDGTVAEIIE